MSDDPFAEPFDTEATVFRPRPSGTAASGSALPARGVARPVPKIGDNPLMAAAAPVLAAAIRITGERQQPPDPERLRNATVAAIRTFERDALATGLDTRSLRAARYAL